VRLVLLFVAMGAVTYVPRLLPLLLLADRHLPPRLLEFLKGFPVAVLAAFVAPLLLAPEGTPAFGRDNLELLVAVPTVVLAVLSRSLIVTVVSGAVLMTLARAVLL
jgi:branched-subunit amino acid transport protein